MSFECSNRRPMNDGKPLHVGGRRQALTSDQSLDDAIGAGAHSLSRLRSLSIRVQLVGCAMLLAACGGGGGDGSVEGTGSTPAAAPAPAPAPTAPAPTAGAGSATLSWVAPQTNADGSVLSDLAGYRIYYGTGSGNYSASITVSDPAATTYTVQDLAASTYYFILKAYDKSNVESASSPEVSKTIQ